ncbi:hypothetical protein JJB11_10975 [Ramlibacter ginsenosidimutans]|uniref:STAS/SEC14 domain-containing protein n=1 Tax=Ramlibacter ginsenosidimutans TaxID=502333 RepID=A0A934TTA6_9BURK|nr:hypothetical protein [Ramlibacter ginsenosidimutans]MBK6006616.1 hypothetical protein [Ramlibacter ginsenosidimutans]
MDVWRPDTEVGPSHRGRLTITADAAGFLRVSCPATADLRWLLAAIDELHHMTVRRPGIRLLADLSAVIAPPGMTEQLLVGEHAARRLGHLTKVASLVASGTRSGLSEGVARKLRLSLRVFTIEAEAIRWLRDE